MDLRTCAEKVIRSFDMLKRLLRERAELRDDEMIIFDPPFTIRILKNEEIIIFYLDDEEIAVIGKDECFLKEKEFEGVVREWLSALTSLSFKRYIPKR